MAEKTYVRLQLGNQMWPDGRPALVTMAWPSLIKPRHFLKKAGAGKVEADKTQAPRYTVILCFEPNHPDLPQLGAAQTKAALDNFNSEDCPRTAEGKPLYPSRKAFPRPVQSAAEFAGEEKRREYFKRFAFICNVGANEGNAPKLAVDVIDSGLRDVRVASTDVVPEEFRPWFDTGGYKCRATIAFGPRPQDQLGVSGWLNNLIAFGPDVGLGSEKIEALNVKEATASSQFPSLRHTGTVRQGDPRTASADELV